MSNALALTERPLKEGKEMRAKLDGCFLFAVAAALFLMLWDCYAAGSEQHGDSTKAVATKLS